MARNKHHKKPGIRVPIGIVAGLAVPLSDAYDSFKGGTIADAGNALLRSMTGYNAVGGNWNVIYMRRGAMPVLLGLAAHKIAGMTGLNRAIARAGIPFVSI